MEVLPCSRVAHIARMKKPYHSNIAFHTRRNALRVAEVWMDEYKSNVYLAWNIPVEVRDDVDANICAPLLFFFYFKKLHMNNVSHMADNKKCPNFDELGISRIITVGAINRRFVLKYSAAPFKLFVRGGKKNASVKQRLPITTRRALAEPRY